ncbi:hypothetical protein [Mariniflexile sp. AS56]|uniref:hypothetical protein n=1 Tax=Mariniflexile sp. AS56 TaxID=3063957 RepID=UPI0026F36D51|nr:hypothetical protein [Mariniflexile sp. AS56]MDO7173710.1 hypothetical protein [Mariniflexile sp. AS56]
MFNFDDIFNSDWRTINTLEKLSHFEETAKESIELLYSLALKKEANSKDAALSFITMFQVHFAETCLSLTDRTQIIEKLEKENGLSELLVNAYSRSLKAQGFSGNIRTEDETYKKNQYKPINEEIIEYWRFSLTKLIDTYINNPNGLRNSARDAIKLRLQEQLAHGVSKDILESLELIIKSEDGLKDDIRGKLLEVKMERFGLRNDVKGLVVNLLERNEPKSLEADLSAVVVNAPWLRERKEEGGYRDLALDKVEDLVQKIIEKKINWIEHIEILLKGNQNHTFYFAEKMSQIYPDKEEILKYMILAYKNIDVKEQSSVFALGLIKGSDNDDFTRILIDACLTDERHALHGIRATTALKEIKFEDLKKILSIIEKHTEFLYQIEYINLSNLTSDEIISFIERVKVIDHAFSLQLIWEYLRQTKFSKYGELNSWLNELLWVDDILSFRSSINTSLHIELLIKRSIDNDPSEEKIKFLLDKIILEYKKFPVNDSLIDVLLFFLLEEYFEISWHYLGHLIAKDKKSTFSQMLYFLQKYKFDTKNLVSWSEKDSDYPAIAMKFMRLHSMTDEGKLEWDPITFDFLVKNSNNSEVFETLYRRFSSFTIVGTATAEKLLNERKNLLKQLIGKGNDDFDPLTNNLIERLESSIKYERNFGENYELGM